MSFRVNFHTSILKTGEKKSLFVLEAILQNDTKRLPKLDISSLQLQKGVQDSAKSDSDRKKSWETSK